jgi:hypothetical protein
MVAASRTLLAGALGFLIAAAVVGCGSGSKAYPVQGQVFHRGQPAAGAVVYFHLKDNKDPSRPVPSGTAGPDGTFRLSTFGTEDGAPPGEYVVTVYWPESGPASGKEKAASRDSPADRLGERFAKPGPNSPTATVEARPNQLPPFQLQ